MEQFSGKSFGILHIDICNTETYNEVPAKETSILKRNFIFIHKTVCTQFDVQLHLTKYEAWYCRIYNYFRVVSTYLLYSQRTLPIFLICIRK